MKKITQVEVDEILRLHKLWLNDNEAGAKADFSECDLSNCNFSKSDLSYCNFSDSILINCDFSECILNRCDFGDADFEGANLSFCNLTGAGLTDCNLTDCNLTGANLDFSSGIPLRCGGLNIKMDKKLMCQLIYHLCSMECDDEEVIKAQNYLLDLANQSHLVDKHGLGKIYF